MVYRALLPLMRTPRLPVVDWTDAPIDLNGLVRFAERRNLVSARVPSHFKRSLPQLFALFVKYCGRSGARISAEALDFLVFKMSRQALGPNQPPLQWVSGFSSRAEELPWREFDHFHLAPKSRMAGALPLFSNMLSCHGQGQLYPFANQRRCAGMEL